MTPDAAIPTGPAGACFDIRISSSGNTILTATSNATIAKMPASMQRGACAASMLPTNAVSIAGRQRRARSQSTGPRESCSRAEEIDVGIMAASDVAPRHACGIRCLCPRSAGNTRARARHDATTTSNNPAANPASRPQETRIASGGGQFAGARAVKHSSRAACAFSRASARPQGR
jgi:hypothetical protein